MPGAECPVMACGTQRSNRQLMCREHWYMVPKGLRAEVFRTARLMWDDVEGGDEEWRKVADEAIAVVETKLGRSGGQGTLVP